MTTQKLVYFGALLAVSTLLLSACGKKTTTSTATPTTSAAQLALEIPDAQKPYISLIPRADGHQLTLKIDNIPSNITSMEYELLYNATDKTNTIQKGLGDTIKLDARSLSRDLLLGTASCTNGCKYSYDTGVNSGTLSLTFITTDNRSTQYQTSFSLLSVADLKKTPLTLSDDTVSIKVSPATGNNYLVLIKNFAVKDSHQLYSIFSDGSGKGTIGTMNPTGLAHDSTTIIIGDYLL